MQTTCDKHLGCNMERSAFCTPKPYSISFSPRRSSQKGLADDCNRDPGRVESAWRWTFCRIKTQRSNKKTGFRAESPGLIWFIEVQWASMMGR